MMERMKTNMIKRIVSLLLAMLLLCGWSKGELFPQQKFATRILLPVLDQERDKPLMLIFSGTCVFVTS